MRCVTCGADIPPQWVKAIEQNSCPGCGGQIMTPEAEELMRELSEAIARMPNDAQGLAGWLLSNYRFKKIGTGEPTEKFHRANSQNQQEAQEEQGQQKQQGIKVAKSPYEAMLERTQMAKQVNNTNASLQTRNARLQEMAANIQGIEDPYGIPSGGVDDTSAADQEDYEALQEYMSQGIDPFKGTVSQDNGALSPDQIMSMQNSNTDYVQADMDGIARANIGRNDGSDYTEEERKLIAKTGTKGRQVVENNRLRRIKAQEAVEGGGGSFRRSS